MAINITTTDNLGQMIQVENNTTAHEEQKVNKEVNNKAKPEETNKSNEETSTDTAKVPDNKENESEEESDNSLNYLNKSEEETDDEESESEDDENDESEEENDDKPKRSGFKKRIDKLTKNNSLLMNEIEQLKLKINGSNNKESESKVKVETDLVKPKLEDFEDLTDYNEALFDYKFELRKKEEQKNHYESKVEEESREVLKAWNDKVEIAKTKYKDWNKIAESNIPLSVHMRTEILESKIGTDITYYLFKNPKEAIEISQMPAKNQIKAMDRIEVKLEEALKKKSEVKKVSNAPNPVKTIAKSSASSGKKSLDEMDQKEYNAFREASKKK